MVECLTVLFKDVKDILLLGQLLRMPEETLAAIDSYYEDDCHKMSHMLSLWLMEDHEDPVTPLRDALNSLGKEEVSQTLVLLTSLGEWTRRVDHCSMLTFSSRHPRTGCQKHIVCQC